MIRPHTTLHKNKSFSRHHSMAPLPLPTGQIPYDSLGIIWRRNEVFLDINSYNIGSGATLIWILTLTFLIITLSISTLDPEGAIDIMILLSVILAPATAIVILGIIRPAPTPLRFNRQRREVCILKPSGTYWIAPWEQVIAETVEVSGVNQGGKITQGMMYIRLNNPDLHASKKNRSHAIAFPCSGNMALSLWECIRTYMEVGPDSVVSTGTSRFTRPKGIFASYLDDLKEAARRKGWALTLIWDGFFGLVFFNVLLADYLERKKLYPLPDLDHPDIIEWSKPLPPEQWAKPSAEFQAALAEYEARRAS